MRRQLPIVDIAGTSFYVDVLRDELRQTDNPVNTIPFGVFDQDGDGYTFLYDTETRSMPESRNEIKELGERYKWVTLPALMELDPEGIALKYDIPLSILCPDLHSITPEDDEEYDSYEEEF